MKVSTSTMLGLAAASSLVSAAPPTGTEEIVIGNFYLRKAIDADGKSTVDAVSFNLSGRNATRLTCYVDDPIYPEPTHATECGRDSNYYFQLLPGTDGSEFRLNILHVDYGLAYVPPPLPPNPANMKTC